MSLKPNNGSLEAQTRRYLRVFAEITRANAPQTSGMGGVNTEFYDHTAFRMSQSWF